MAHVHIGPKQHIEKIKTAMQSQVPTGPSSTDLQNRIQELESLLASQPTERLVEVIKHIEVPVEKIVHVPVHVEVIKHVEVPVEKRVEIPVDRIIEKKIPVDRIVHITKHFVPTWVYGVIGIQALLIFVLLITK